LAEKNRLASFAARSSERGNALDSKLALRLVPGVGVEPLTLFKTHKLLIPKSRRSRKIRKSAQLRYTAGTQKKGTAQNRENQIPLCADLGGQVNPANSRSPPAVSLLDQTIAIVCMA
jgi:hypothetical protein